MGVADLLNSGSSPKSLWEGKIAEDATSVDEAVEVIIPSFDTDSRWGPCPWTPRIDEVGASMLPSRGDRCLVGMASTDEPGALEPWIIAWWPY